MVRRRDHTLHTINTIEKTIQHLQQDCQSTSSLDQINVGESSPPVSTHNKDIMDAVNANELANANKDDLSDTLEIDSLQSDTLPLSGQFHDNSGIGHGNGNTHESLNANGIRNQASSTDHLLHRGSHTLPMGQMPPAIEAVLHGTWPFAEKSLWHSSPPIMGMPYKNGMHDSVHGIMSTSSVANQRSHSTNHLLTNKVEMVYGLLSMFSSEDRDDMSRTLLAMSSSPDSCVAMRQSGCLPLLIQLLYGGDGDVSPTRETRLRAAQALHNIVHSHPDDKRGRREARVLRLLEQICDYSDYLYERLQRTSAGRGPLLDDDMDRHPCSAMAALMKLSFDEDHRHAMCLLGGLHAIAELIKRDHDGHGSATADQYCVTLRRYAGMALTNLTFGDGANKSLLCSFKMFLKSLVSQLNSPSEDLRQVTASVLRNLSWRADGGSKNSLLEVGAVSILIQAALTARKESTLKVILSAVWNLSAHCSVNKADICAVDGALSFICSTLTYKSQSKTLAIVENGGGILRNISSHIAVCEDLRQVLRDHNTLEILLSQLRSPSLTVVSNACGTLWNLSARCSQDQRTLWELGAVPMLRSLINSKHKMISMGSSAALKNLLAARPEGMSVSDSRHGLGLPTLQARKQRALEQELDPSLSETCDNIETSPRASPTNPPTNEPHYFVPPNDSSLFYSGVGRPMFNSLGAQFNGTYRSESRDSISSTHSDNSHDRMRQLLMMRHQASLENAPTGIVAPPAHGFPDTAKMTREEIQRCLEAYKFESGDEEVVARRITNLKDLYSNSSGDSATNYGDNFNSREVNRRVSQQATQSPVSQRRNKESERIGVQPHSEAHYNSYKQSDAQIDNFVREVRDVPQNEEEDTVKPKDDLGNYTETDLDNLDQPTNYSLRYSEERDAEDGAIYRRPQKPTGEAPGQFFDIAAVQNDQVKTYCTEGTPYETPYNFSTSTSMTDLRDNAIKEEMDRQASVGKKKKEKRNSDISVKDLGSDSQVLGKDADKDKLEPLPPAHVAPVKSGLSSGLMTPGSEKPITYCVEGTPVGCLSRFSSISSLSSSDANKEEMELMEEDLEMKDEDMENTHGPAPPIVREVEIGGDYVECHTPNPQQREVEGKSSNYEETPLMFSRATSVSSLSSFDVQSIHDDHSSVVSDFSRFTSGAISPSDLPDSPTQTVPPSPKCSRPSSPKLCLPQGQNFNNQRGTGIKNSTGVFNEAPRAWQEEGTPIEFSCTTSLSSLTIDDDLPAVMDMPTHRLRGDGKDSSEATCSEDSRTNSRESHLPPHNMKVRVLDRIGNPRVEAITVAEGQRQQSRIEECDDRIIRERSEERSQPDSESEDLLAEIISSGMPSGIPRTSNIPTPSGIPNLSGLPSGITKPQGKNLFTAPTCVSGKMSSTSIHNEGKSPGRSGWTSDSLMNYCTEDTPASGMSHAGSISELSVLSIPGSPGPWNTSGRAVSLNDSGDNSSDNDNILEQCIQSAMPKARPGPKGKELKSSVKRHGSGQTCSHTPSAPAVSSPRRSPQHRAIPVARVNPAVKVGGSRVSPRPLSSHDDSDGDQIKNWATEGTPATFSRADSLSSLSCCDEESNRPSHEGSPQAAVNQSEPRTPPPHSRNIVSTHHQQIVHGTVDADDEFPRQFAIEGTPGGISRHSSLSSLDGVENPTAQMNPSTPQTTNSHNFVVEDTPVCFSRNSSLSSLSVESYSEEPTAKEQALLQACISQGMPKSKSKIDHEVRQHIRSGSHIPTSYTLSSSRMLQEGATAHSHSREHLNPNTASSSQERINAIDVESSKLYSDVEQSEKNEMKYQKFDEEDEEFSDSGEMEDEISAAEKSEVTEMEVNLEMTATFLVERAEVTENNDCSAVKTTTDIPHETVTEKTQDFLISESSPEGQTESSGEDKKSWEAQLSVEKSSPESRSFPDSNSASMSESGLLAREAIKVAKAVAVEAKMLSSDDTSHMSQNGVSDAFLENIRPPKTMMAVSLVNSIEDHIPINKNNNGNNGRNLECRHTRKLPEMVTRALGYLDFPENNSTDSGPISLASSCHSNVDNIAPPSMMDEEYVDMESSMISVASITSEVAESRISPPSESIMDHSTCVGQPARQLAAIFQQEAINMISTQTLVAGTDDASTYCEVADLVTECEATMGPVSDTELAGDDLDYPDLPLDGASAAATPRSAGSGCSSAHSSPARGSSGHGTPKARRQLSKDRFKTFTKNYSKSDAIYSQTNLDPTSVIIDSQSSPKSGRTSTQRRREDAERFKTRTISSDLDVTEPIDFERNDIDISPEVSKEISPHIYKDQLASNSPSGEANDILSPAEECVLPARTEARRSLRQKRQEDRSRYQTRTINVDLASINPAESEGSTLEADSGMVDFQEGNELMDLTAEELEVLQQDANIIICTLNENREGMTSESSEVFSEEVLSEENILDIETLSLISNEEVSDMKNFLFEYSDQHSQGIPAYHETEAEDMLSENEDDEQDESKPILRRPRIVKPGEEAPKPQPEEEPPVGKTIRGRRKPLYQSQKRSNTGSHIVKPVTPSVASSRSRITQRFTGAVTSRTSTVRPNTAASMKQSSPKLPRPTRASALRQRSSLRGSSSGEDSPTSRSPPVRLSNESSPGSSNGSSPRLGIAPQKPKSARSRSRSLVRPEPPRQVKRQNTFTKDDERPSVEHTTQSSRTTMGPPQRSGIQKPKFRRDVIQPVLSSTHAGRSMMPKSGSQDLSPGRGGGKGASAKSVSLTRDAQPPSAKDMAEWGKDAQKSKIGVKKEVTSRIASLWKKVEKAQNKPKEKDTKSWITKNKKDVKGVNSNKPKPLVRSSTFEKLPGVDESKPSESSSNKTRLGLKLSKLRGRDTKSSPPSETSTPVDPRPQCLVSPTRSRLSELATRPGSGNSFLRRDRAATHPVQKNQAADSSQTAAKRISRLGSFVSVEDESKGKSTPQSAIVPPFNYHPPVFHRPQEGVATRIPLPSKLTFPSTPSSGGVTDTDA
ncbi:unnamed protein product, partial [Meganyctiphanes norvegica]